MAAKDAIVNSSLISLRTLSYLALLLVGFYICAYFTDWWYEKTESLSWGTPLLQGAFNQVIFFFSVPLLACVIFGASYEIILLKHRLPWMISPGSAAPNDSREASPKIAKLAAIIQYKFYVGWNTWLTVGELVFLTLWLTVQLYVFIHGIEHTVHHFKEETSPCPDDPSKNCYNDESRFPPGTPANTVGQYILMLVAFYFGWTALFNLIFVMIPVSRSSRIWIALGIPFERAVLYHKIFGHSNLWHSLLHGVLYYIYWIWEKDWDYAWHESADWNSDLISNPAGWTAMLIGVIFWIPSIGFFRRRFYSVFKISHWLFWAYIGFTAMHFYGTNLVMIGVMGIYLAHGTMRITSRVSWKRWLRTRSDGGVQMDSTRALAHATGAGYTVVVLTCPGSDLDRNAVPVRGGSFIYMTVPGATAQSCGESHALTVAMRGAPYGMKGYKLKDCMTIMIKASGGWSTALLRLADGLNDSGALVVDTDGPYTRTETLGFMGPMDSRSVIMFAGGAGLTSFMGHLQDWGEAAAAGASVPHVHLVWACQTMSELEFVGQVIPQLVAAARDKFSMELYCTSVDASAETGVLSVTLPVHPDASEEDDAAAAHSSVALKCPVAFWWPSINDVMRTMFAVGGMYVGYVWMAITNQDINVMFMAGWMYGGLMFILMWCGGLTAILVWETLVSAFGWLMLRHAKEAQIELLQHRDSSDLFAPCIVDGKPMHKAKHVYGDRASSSGSNLDLKPMSPSSGKMRSATSVPVYPGRPDFAAVLAKQAGIMPSVEGLPIRVLTSGPETFVKATMDAVWRAGQTKFTAEEFSYVF